MAVTTRFEALEQSRTMRLAMAGLTPDNIPMLGMAFGTTQLIVLGLALLEILQGLEMTCATSVAWCLERIRDHQRPVHRVAT